jgi:endo-1,3(4)-beta-glucanase
VPVVPAAGNIFTAISYDAPPASMPQRSDHPVKGVGIANSSKPIETNKFYDNMLLGTQEQPAFPYPFQVRWLKGTGSVSAYGIAIAHDVKKNLVLGPGSPASCMFIFEIFACLDR